MFRGRFVRTILLGSVFLAALSGCPGKKNGVDKPQKEEPLLPKDTVMVLALSEHDTLDAAKGALEAALRLSPPAPLPFPRVERRNDRFRVVLARGKGEALTAYYKAIKTAAPQVVASPQQEGGDDVVRLGIVCTEEGAKVPLYGGSDKKGGAQKQIAELTHGQVVVPTAEEEDEGDEEGPSDAERGYLRVLSPKVGLVRMVDVLVPADCTPRDEDNDDGNGRILAGGRLCLTTRFSRKEGDVSHAALLAVTPGYRRCTRFPEAGTFDGFDQNGPGTQFAVELSDKDGKQESIAIYDVSEQGVLTQRGLHKGLSRPAYLEKSLVSVLEDATGQGIVMLTTPEGPPQRLFHMPGPRFVSKAPIHRPAAPTLSEGKIVATFRQACEKDEEQKVRKVARGEFEQCLLEVEVKVPRDGGKDVFRRCHLNNAPSSLEQPIETTCH